MGYLISDFLKGVILWGYFGYFLMIWGFCVIVFVCNNDLRFFWFKDGLKGWDYWIFNNFLDIYVVENICKYFELRN